MSQGKGSSSQKKPPEPEPTPVAGKPLNDTEHNARVLNSMLTSHQKATYGSDFQDTTAARRRDSLLAMPALQLPQSSKDTGNFKALPRFDGKTAPDAVKGRDLWKAVQPPLVNRLGKRSRELYEQAIKQFAVTTNPRYDDDAPGKPRAHIFVWDLSRAMSCEIPHFVGARELTLAQTCDWLRHEGPMRGWKRLNDFEAVDVANTGLLVVALPRDRLNKLLAVVAPQAAPPDNKPRLTGVGRVRSDGAHPREFFGAPAIDCFFHD